MSELHPRVMIVQQAKAEMAMEIAKIIPEYDLDYGDVLHSYSQSISNLFLNDKVYTCAFHRRLEEILQVYTEKYELSIGEKSQLLASYIANDSKYLIRWERHGNFDEEGDFL